MERAIFAAVLCIGSAVSAQQPQPVSAIHPATPAAGERERRLAMREHMGQRQLDLLVDSIVGSDEQARSDPRHADQMVASNAR